MTVLGVQVHIRPEFLSLAQEMIMQNIIHNKEASRSQGIHLNVSVERHQPGCEFQLVYIHEDVAFQHELFRLGPGHNFHVES